MTSSHRYFSHAMGVVIDTTCPHIPTPISHPVADKGVDMETLVDDFVTFYAAGRVVTWLGHNSII